MYRIDFKPRLLPWGLYEWTLILSSYGMARGRCWTRRGCERELMRTQSEWFAE